MIVGLGGNNTVYGEFEIGTPTFILGTDDRIFGEGWSDLLISDFRTLNIPLGVAAVSSTDYIDGGEEADTIAGGFIDAMNTVIGGTDLGSGNDTIYGDVKVGNNNITPVGTGNNDTINGGVGTDTGDAGPGIDTCTNMESVMNCEL